MAAKPGTVTFLKVDNAAGSLTDIGVYLDKTEFPFTSQMLDVSTMGTQAKSFIVGQTGGDTAAVSGPYSSTLWLHFGSLIAAQNAGTASHSFLYGPGGSVSGEAKVSGEFLVASMNPPSSVGGRVEWSASLQITGAVTLASF